MKLVGMGRKGLKMRVRVERSELDRPLRQADIRDPARRSTEPVNKGRADRV